MRVKVDLKTDGMMANIFLLRKTDSGRAAWKRFLRAVSFLVLLLLSAHSGLAQGGDTSVFNHPTLPVHGVGHEYINGLNETVNPADGTVSLSIPITMPTGRGLTLPFSITYSSNNSTRMTNSTTLAPYTNGPPPSTAVVLGSAWNNGTAFDVTGGWEYVLPMISFSVGQQYACLATSDTGSQTPAYNYYSFGYSFRGPNGEDHPLTSLKIGQSSQSNCEAYNAITTDAEWGANVSLPASPGAPSGIGSGVFPPTVYATISDPHGTIYDFSNQPLHTDGATSSFFSIPGTIEDRNGNIVTIHDSLSSSCNGVMACNSGSLTVTDSAGRTALSLNAAAGTTTVSGLTNSYKINWEALPLPQGQDSYVYPISLVSLNPTPEDNSGAGGAYCPIPGVTQGLYPTAETGLSSIQLPNQKSFSFEYDPVYNLLSQVTYPTGATVSYKYGLNTQSSFNSTDAFYSVGDGYEGIIAVPAENGGKYLLTTACAYRYSKPVLTQRTVSFNGATNLVQQFTYTTNWPTAPEPQGTGPVPWNWSSKSTTVTTTNYSGSNSISYSTVYTYEPYIAPTNLSTPADQALGIVSGNTGDGSGYILYNNTTAPAVAAQVPGNEIAIQYFKDTNTSGTPALTIVKGWTGLNQLECEVHQTDNGLISGTFYTWQAEGVLADKKEFGFGQLSSTSVCYDNAPVPTVTPYRETVTTYQALSPNPIYYQGAANTIQDRPCKVIVYGSGAKLSETDSYYDGGTSTCGAAGTPSVTSVGSLPSGTHDETNFSAASQSARGNATTITAQCFGCTNPTATATFTYDETGQTLSVVDPRGFPTNYSYTDSPSGGNAAGNSNAYITKVTDALGYATNYSYNYPMGSLTSEEDPNKNYIRYKYNTQAAGCAYTDGLNRLTEIDYPDNGVTTYCYDDAVPSVTTTKLQTPNPTVTSVAIMDGMGHVIQTQTSETNGADVVSTAYGGEGQVYTVTNPFLSSSQPSNSLVQTPSGSKRVVLPGRWSCG